MPNAPDPRWILLTEGGDYSTIGRHREPDEEDIARAAAALERVGASGWIAIMSDSIYGRGVPEVLMVRPLREPGISFETATLAFRQRWKAMTLKHSVGDV